MFTVALLVALASASAAPEVRTFTVDDLLAVKRVSDPQVSPDGKLVAFVVGIPDLEKNTMAGHLWVVPAEGGAARQLTNGEKGESRPRWSPDSRTIAFITGRGGSPQVWLIPVDGGEARRLTDISTGAGGHVWSPTGAHIAFTSEVRPGLDGGDGGQKKREEEIKASGIQARVIDGLLYRHWDSWRDGKRSHIFIVPIGGGEARDLTPGERDAPPIAGGSGDGFAFSPDGKEIAYGAGPVSASEAWSTNADLFTVGIDGAGIQCLTAANKGFDGSPAWSPDGKSIAYLSQARDGYEADRFRLAVLDRAAGRTTYLAPDSDICVGEFHWAPDSRSLWIVGEDEGLFSHFRAAAPGAPGGTVKVFAQTGFSAVDRPAAGGFLVGIVQSMVRPPEVARLELAAGAGPGAAPEPRRLTGFNDDLLARKDMPSRESVRYPGALGARVQAWLLKPPGSQAGGRRPLVLFIHGGPQGAWMDTFHYRWNAALFAARDRLVLCPNFHGSTGFGQAFTEQISGDWGGACFEDLMKGVGWAVEGGLADPERLAAMGGSFGGYMTNWILGHTDRFKALVSHAGVFNLESDYGLTEELWFPEWEFGAPYWKDRRAYEKFSPHRFAARFRTPTLVIHGELDFRVPAAEGLQLFTALQRQGVPSRLLYFPDEGHWILKPKNVKLWTETILEWFDRFLGAGK